MDLGVLNPYIAGENKMRFACGHDPGQKSSDGFDAAGEFSPTR
jgi:hypothetical protein